MARAALVGTDGTQVRQNALPGIEDHAGHQAKWKLDETPRAIGAKDRPKGFLAWVLVRGAVKISQRKTQPTNAIFRYGKGD